MPQTRPKKLILCFNPVGEQSLFPDENTPNRLFNGIRFADLPICNIKATPNNTIISLCNAQGN